MDGYVNSGWLTTQAIVAAGRLANVPTHLLGPAGRSLQAAVTGGSIGFQPPTRAQASGLEGGRLASQASVSGEGDFQPSLVMGLPSGQAKSARRR